MTLKDLYLRIKDTTGLEVLTVSDMYTIYLNCAADLTSRGYREFEERIYDPYTESMTPEEMEGSFIALSPRKFTLISPTSCGKMLYVKVVGPDRQLKSARISLTNNYIDSIYTDGIFSFNFDSERLRDAVYYIKADSMYIETRDEISPTSIILGYYKKISRDIIPDSWTYTNENNLEITSTDVYDPAILEHIILPIRPELEDCFALYGVYYSYNKRLKETEMIAMHLNNYKYLVEDLLHELNYEDTFNEEESVITVDDARI